MRAIRRTRSLPRADMTPLVNIALLLIVFFAWVKQLQQSTVMQFHLPIRCKCEDDPVPISANLYLLDANKICFLTYLPDQRSAEAIEIDYTASQLRARLSLLSTTALHKRTTILIVPTPESTIKNLVDVLNALKTNGRISYVLSSQLIQAEKRLLNDYQLYRRNHSHDPISMPFSFYRDYRKGV